MLGLGGQHDRDLLNVAQIRQRSRGRDQAQPDLSIREQRRDLFPGTRQLARRRREIEPQFRSNLRLLSIHR